MGKIKYKQIIILILILAFFLRFWRIGDRWFLISDSARDVLVGREALRLKQFPLIGSFSSAGPFVFGPLFYWFISLSYLPDPNQLILPWINLGLLLVVFVWLMAEIGRRIGGRKLGIILAILAAVSPAQIYRSLVLTQHSFVSLAAALALLAFISFIKTKKSKYIFILGLAIGSGISMHYQALNLLFFALIIFNKKFIKNFVLFILGLVLPLAPLIYWDGTQGWSNTKNILDYFFIGQARLWLPDRWLDYLFQFWPLLWSSIIGQLLVFGWILPILFLISLIGTRKKTVWWIMIVFLIQFILLRYHKSERFEGYLLYFHPLVILFSGLGIEYLGQKMHLAGFLLLLLVFLFSLQADWRQISTTQNQSHLLAAQVSDIKKALPGKKFSLFDYELSSQAYSYALSAYLDKENLIDEQGIPLGACLSDCPGDYPKLSIIYPPIIIVNLGDYHSSDWYNVNPKTVFESVTLWWKKGKLQSSFSPGKFFLERIGH